MHGGSPRIKALLGVVLLLGLFGFITAVAQPASSAVDPAALRTPEELDELLGPIALYPDALVALILPAASIPADIVHAADFINAHGDPGQIAGQPWDESVKSLAHYPEVVTWMSNNLTWTQQVGDAWLAQPADVMASIQQLRARAVAAGSLTNTPQQQVVTDGDEIRIIPAQPDVIYVPRYDPDFVYEDQPSYVGPWLTFSDGYPEGLWLNYDLDWASRGIWIGQWHPGWDYRHPAWRHPVGGGPDVGHPWRPLPGRRPSRPIHANLPHPGVVHPAPLPGAPARPPQNRGTVGPAAGRPQINPPTAARPDFRGYPPANPTRIPTVPVRPAPAPSNVFGGYNRGSEARAASQRGQMSRQQSRPSNPGPASRPAPAPQQRGPSGGTSGPGGNDRKRN